MLLMLVLVSFESCRSPLQHGTLIHPRTHSANDFSHKIFLCASRPRRLTSVLADGNGRCSAGEVFSMLRRSRKPEHCRMGFDCNAECSRSARRTCRFAASFCHPKVTNLQLRKRPPRSRPREPRSDRGVTPAFLDLHLGVLS